MKYFIFAITFIFLTAISMNTNAQDNKSEVIGTITSVPMEVKLVANKYCLVPMEDASKRYLDSDMTAEYQQEGKKVVVSANVLKAPAGVRMMATPIAITEIAPYRTKRPVNQTKPTPKTKPAPAKKWWQFWK